MPAGQTLSASTALADGSYASGGGAAKPVPGAIQANPALICSNRPAQILSVNGKAAGTTFSPDSSNNLYHIEGCGFGIGEGKAKVFSPGLIQKEYALRIFFWSDNEIIAELADPDNIRGEVDRNDLTLVVATAAGPQIQKSGQRFYAARETVYLQQMPASFAKFASQGVIKSRSPGSSSVSAPESITIGVVRTDYGNINPGIDMFDFSALAPGFTTESFTFQSIGFKQGTEDFFGTLYQYGSFSANWVGDNIQVNFGSNHLHYSPGGCIVGATTKVLLGTLTLGILSEFFPSFNFNSCGETSWSAYALKVWVTGPRGVDPTKR